MSILDNLNIVLDNIARYNSDAQLVVATKTQSIEDIMSIMASDRVLSAGENRVQELLTKYQQGIRWDFIGQLQSNKVKYIVDKVELIHSVDRISLAQVIDKESAKINKVQDILIEINAGKEQNKGGIYLEDTQKFLDNLAGFDNIKVRGIMAVVPIDWQSDMLRSKFDEVYNLFDKYKNSTFCHLSMGMSNDYILALQSGANLVRVGRAIFGEREFNG